MFGVVKRLKIINVCRTTQAALYTPEYALLHQACVSFAYNNKSLTFVAYIGPKSRTERPRKTKIGTQAAR